MLIALRPLLLLIAFTAVPQALAQAAEPAPGNQREDAGDRVREVERDGGRVLQAEPMQSEGRQVYRLKVLTPEGRVRVLHDDRGRASAESRRDARARFDRTDFGDPGRQAPSPRRYGPPQDRPRNEPPPPAPSQGPPPPPGADGNPGARY